MERFFVSAPLFNEEQISICARIERELYTRVLAFSSLRNLTMYKMDDPTETGRSLYFQERCSRIRRSNICIGVLDFVLPNGMVSGIPYNATVWDMSAFFWQYDKKCLGFYVEKPRFIDPTIENACHKIIYGWDDLLEFLDAKPDNRWDLFK